MAAAGPAPGFLTREEDLGVGEGIGGGLHIRDPLAELGGWHEQPCSEAVGPVLSGQPLSRHSPHRPGQVRLVAVLQGAGQLVSGSGRGIRRLSPSQAGVDCFASHWWQGCSWPASAQWASLTSRLVPFNHERSCLGCR